MQAMITDNRLQARRDDEISPEALSTYLVWASQEKKMRKMWYPRKLNLWDGWSSDLRFIMKPNPSQALVVFASAHYSPPDWA